MEETKREERWAEYRTGHPGACPLGCLRQTWGGEGRPGGMYSVLLGNNLPAVPRIPHRDSHSGHLPAEVAWAGGLHTFFCGSRTRVIRTLESGLALWPTAVANKPHGSRDRQDAILLGRYRAVRVGIPHSPLGISGATHGAPKDQLHRNYPSGAASGQLPAPEIQGGPSRRLERCVVALGLRRTIQSRCPRNSQLRALAPPLATPHN